MNLPNQLTLLRLAMTAVFVPALTSGLPFSRTAAAALFLLASLTDFADGRIARRRNLITDFGKLMDSLADKILVVSAFICLVGMRHLPAWAVVVVVAREFLITGLRALAASKGRILPAERLGKHKTFWQMATITFLLLTLAAEEWRGLAGGELSETAAALREAVTPALLAVVVGFTVYSGLGYLWKHRDLISDR